MKVSALVMYATEQQQKEIERLKQELRKAQDENRKLRKENNRVAQYEWFYKDKSK